MNAMDPRQWELLQQMLAARQAAQMRDPSLRRNAAPGEDSAWESFDPRKTRIVHVKSALRRAIFDGKAEDMARPGVQRLVEVWKGLEAQCMEVA